MTIATTKRAWRIRLLALALSLVPAATPVALWATECVAVDSHDQPRECTATEELGACMSATQESLMTCNAASGGSFWSRLKCGGAALIDDIACVAAMPVDIVFD